MLVLWSLMPVVLLLSVPEWLLFFPLLLMPFNKSIFSFVTPYLVKGCNKFVLCLVFLVCASLFPYSGLYYSLFDELTASGFVVNKRGHVTLVIPLFGFFTFGSFFIIFHLVFGNIEIVCCWWSTIDQSHFFIFTSYLSFFNIILGSLFGCWWSDFFYFSFCLTYFWQFEGFTIL